MNNLFYKKNTRGFTLIETLFAVLIFSAALISLMAIAGRGISASTIAREQITAHYLAQEGLEVVRNIRDSNFKTGAPWSQIISDCIEGNPCNVTYQGGTPGITSCSNNCAVFQDTHGFFTDSGDISPFTRSIVLTPQDTDEYVATSTVSWMAKGIKRSVVLTTFLKDWSGVSI